MLVPFLAQLTVAGDDLLKRCETVQKEVLRDPKFNVLMDVGPVIKENNVERQLLQRGIRPKFLNCMFC